MYNLLEALKRKILYILNHKRIHKYAKPFKLYENFGLVKPTNYYIHIVSDDKHYYTERNKT